MTFYFRRSDFAEMGITPPSGWNPGRRPGDRPQTAAERQAKSRRVQFWITHRVVHRCKTLQAARRRFEQHLGADVAERVLAARSIAELRSIVDDVENGVTHS